MSWYFCYGCGPSVRCDTCGATECGQDLKDDCPGCVKARALRAKGPPRNIRLPDKGYRPRKANRRWYNAWHDRKRPQIQLPPNLYGKKDRRPREVKIWAALAF